MEESKSTLLHSSDIDIAPGNRELSIFTESVINLERLNSSQYRESSGKPKYSFDIEKEEEVLRYECSATAPRESRDEELLGLAISSRRLQITGDSKGGLNAKLCAGKISWISREGQENDIRLAPNPGHKFPKNDGKLDFSSVESNSDSSSCLQGKPSEVKQGRFCRPQEGVNGDDGLMEICLERVYFSSTDQHQNFTDTNHTPSTTKSPEEIAKTHPNNCTVDSREILAQVGKKRVSFKVSEATDLGIHPAKKLRINAEPWQGLKGGMFRGKERRIENLKKMLDENNNLCTRLPSRSNDEYVYYFSSSRPAGGNLGTRDAMELLKRKTMREYHQEEGAFRKKGLLRDEDTETYHVVFKKRPNLKPAIVNTVRSEAQEKRKTESVFVLADSDGRVRVTTQNAPVNPERQSLIPSQHREAEQPIMYVQNRLLSTQITRERDLTGQETRQLNNNAVMKMQVQKVAPEAHDDMENLVQFYKTNLQTQAAREVKQEGMGFASKNSDARYNEIHNQPCYPDCSYGSINHSYTSTQHLRASQSHPTGEKDVFFSVNSQTNKNGISYLSAGEYHAVNAGEKKEFQVERYFETKPRTQLEETAMTEKPNQDSDILYKGNKDTREWHINPSAFGSQNMFPKVPANGQDRNANSFEVLASIDTDNSENTVELPRTIHAETCIGSFVPQRQNDKESMKINKKAVTNTANKSQPLKRAKRCIGSGAGEEGVPMATDQAMAGNSYLDPNSRYKCEWPACNKAFRHYSFLVLHKRLHTGEKPYVCTWEGCGKQFRRSDEYQRHYRIHTGLKPYPCSMCSKKFKRSDHRLFHYRAIHGISKEELHRLGLGSSKVTSLN